MRSVLRIVLLVFLAQAFASSTGALADKFKIVDQSTSREQFVDNVVGHLIHRTFPHSLASSSDLENATLGKPGLLATAPSRTVSGAATTVATPAASRTIRRPLPSLWGRHMQVGSPARDMQCSGLKTGIVGLPNVGKSTLFNAVMKESQAQAANFPFCTIEPNVGLVAVPDTRLDVLSKLSSSKSTVPTSVSFVDIAGLVKGASEGEGLGNKFLSNIRETDAIVHVVRCFKDDDVIHVDGSVDPLRDVDVITTELALSDLGQIERRLEKLAKDRKMSAKEKEAEQKALDAISVPLNGGKAARLADLDEAEFELVQGLQLLTMKPVIYAANVAESDLKDNGASNEYVAKLKKLADEENSPLVIISAKMEAELVEFDDEERNEYLEEIGAKETGLENLIRVAYDMLGLRTYFTSGEQETKAWTIQAGMKAPQAAGVIHTDFEKGFIRAETIAYKDYVDSGSTSAARDKGLLRSEGKEYVVEEGDVILFRFNV